MHSNNKSLLATIISLSPDGSVLKMHATTFGFIENLKKILCFFLSET